MTEGIGHNLVELVVHLPRDFGRLVLEGHFEVPNGHRESIEAADLRDLRALFHRIVPEACDDVSAGGDQGDG